MTTITLSTKGQLVIPKTVRDGAHLVPGDRLEVALVGDEIRLRRVIDSSRATTLDQVAGCLARPGRKRMSAPKERAAVLAMLKARSDAS